MSITQTLSREEVINHLIGYIDQIENKNTILQQTIRSYETEEETVKLKNEINNLRILLRQEKDFKITEEQKIAINKWIADHELEKHSGKPSAGLGGGRYTYEFTPTTIGTIGVIKCVCGDEFIFQDI